MTFGRYQIGSPTFVSAFSGCGGFDLGLQLEGFDCLGAYDIDPLALDVHRANLNARAVQCDLAEGMPSDARDARPDVLIAGSPCQGFSTLGLRRLNDPRTSLLLSAGRIALQLRPRVFVLENVAGATSGQHRRYWDSLHASLRSHGYQTVTIRVVGTDVGVPQIRNRVLLVAWESGVLCDPCLESSGAASLRDTLSGLDGLPNHHPVPLSPGSTSARIAAKIRP